MTAERPTGEWLSAAAVRVVPWLLCCGVAVTAFLPFFAGTGALLPLGAAVLLAALMTTGIGIGIGPPLLRRAESVVVLSALAYAGFALFVLYPLRSGHGLPGPAALVALGRGLRDGWALMLTTGLPADPTFPLLIVPTLLAWAAATATVMLVERTRAALVPLIPVLLLYVVALGATAPRGGAGLWHAGALTTVGLLVVLLRVTVGNPGDSPEATAVRGRRGSVGRLTLGVPLIGAVVVLSAALTAVLPIADGSDRYEPRTLHTAPVSVIGTLNPLVNVRPQLEASRPRTAFTVQISAVGGRLPPAGRRIRTAALEDFDGASWRPHGVFRPAGKTLPESQPLAVQTVEVRAQFSVGGLEGPFLPTLGQPVWVDAMGVAFDAESGTLVATDGNPAGRRYELRSRVPVPSARQLREAVPLSGGETAVSRHLSALDPVLRGSLERAARSAATGDAPMARLTALARYLAAPGRFPYDLTAPPGHSLGTVLRMLGTGGEEDRHGYAEQHAAAFAVLARVLGYPTRIAVGYLLTAPTAAGGAVAVTTATAHAWPEVAFQGLGWVPFEPTDIRHLGHGAVRSLVPLPGGSEGPGRVQTLPPAIVDDIDPSGLPAQGLVRAADVGSLAVAVAAVAVVFVLVVPVVKWGRRRRRQHRGPPARRVAGAWREVRDRLRERGLAVPDSSTPAEAVELVSAFGGVGPAVGRLATIVTASTFAPEEPAEEEARRAWELAADVRRALAAGVPWPRRVVSSVDVRPLIPRRVDRLPPRRLGDEVGVVPAGRWP